MRSLRAALAFALLALVARPLSAEDLKKCLELSGRRDTADYVGAGLRVLVSVRNTCSEDVAGANLRFLVTVRSKNGGTAGTQRGRFSGTVKPYDRAETVVFVGCDAERAGEIEVELVD